MVNHTSAREREETPHAIKSTKNRTLNLNLANSQQRTANSKQQTAGTLAKNKTRNLDRTGKAANSDAVRRRAQAVIKDRSIDAQSRALIRYGLAINDPWLSELVRRADAGETIIYTVNSLKHPHPARRIQARGRWKH